MIYYPEDMLNESYEDYKKSMPKDSNVMDIENFRRIIFEPLLEEMHNEEN